MSHGIGACNAEQCDVIGKVTLFGNFGDIRKIAMAVSRKGVEAMELIQKYPLCPFEDDVLLGTKKPVPLSFGEDPRCSRDSYRLLQPAPRFIDIQEVGILRRELIQFLSLETKTS